MCHYIWNKGASYVILECSVAAWFELCLENSKITYQSNKSCVDNGCVTACKAYLTRYMLDQDVLHPPASRNSPLLRYLL